MYGFKKDFELTCQKERHLKIPRQVDPVIEIAVECQKCFHCAVLPMNPVQRQNLHLLVCSQCGAKGWDITIEYLDIHF